jgi:hypothetical protein
MIEMQSVAKVVLVCGSGIAPTAIRSLLKSSEPGWSSGPESDSSRCVPMWSRIRYAGSVEQPAISIWRDRHGLWIRRQKSVVKPGMLVDTQHTDKYGVVIGASFRCAKCGQGIFVWAD